MKQFKEQMNNHREYCERKVKLESEPFIENLEIISVCNFNCTICIAHPHRGKKALYLDEIKNFIESNIKYLEDQYLWLHFFGEPLIHSNIIELISYLIKIKKIRTRISTNCSLLTPEISEKLVSSGLDLIVFSIDGIEKIKFEKIRIGSDFEQIIKNVNRFLEIKERLKSKTPITQYINSL